MTYLNKTQNIMFDKLFSECDNFPSSLSQSTMTYNYGRLTSILQKKEISLFTESPEIIEEVYRLTEQFGTIAHNIVKDKGNQTLDSYSELEKIIENTLSGNLYIYAKQWGLSVKALFYYKQKKYQKAIDYSLECIVLNEYLIREGVQTLLLRSAEQNRNISRTLFRRGDWQEGAALAKNLLEYLFNNKSKNLYGKIFHEESQWHSIPYIREGYAYECFRGFVSQMIHLDRISNGKTPNLFPYFFGDFTLETDTPDRLIIFNWLELKTAYHKGDFAEFISDCIEYMNEPMSQLYDILKISLFLDLNHLIEKSSFKHKKKLQSKISHHLETKLFMSDNLRNDLSAKNFALNDFTKS